MNRNLKVRLVQIFLLLTGGLIIFTTYFNIDSTKEKIISPSEKKKIKIDNKSNDKTDVFYNIKYSGFDLAGNRYVLTSNEATVNKDLQEIINMKTVNALFFFKDNTTLIIDSDFGVYNNKTLNMVFEKNVKAKYENSKLEGEKIVYLNSQRTLEVSDNVMLYDEKGTMSADKLLFDLETKTVDISSYTNKIKTNINIK